MPISSDVAVLSMQHPNDSVAQLDGASHGDTANWVSTRTPTDAGDAAHGADSYANTAAHELDANTTRPAVTSVKEQQSTFFSDTEIEHRFSGAESSRAEAYWIGP